jgi:4-hydroxybenzoate polyprenyltransferase
MLSTDTIYACQDKADDIEAGVHSTAILFGSWIRPLLTGYGLLFAMTLSACLLGLSYDANSLHSGYAGMLNRQGLGFLVVSLGGTATHLSWQYASVNLDDPKSCKRKPSSFASALKI